MYLENYDVIIVRMGGFMKIRKGIILGLVCLAFLSGCGKTPKLQNGEEAVVTFKKGDLEHQISAEEVYEELKSNFGLEATLKLIDTYIFETEFADYKDTAKKDAENYIKAWEEANGGEEALLNAIRQYTNYYTIDGFKDYLYVSYLESHAIEEYAKTLVTEKEINNYYKNDVKGDVELYHILVTPKVTDDMSSDEKTKAEETAKNTILNIIDELKDSKKPFDKFKELVSKYSEDEDSKSKDGSLGYINYHDLDSKYDELLDAAYKLKDGEYSTKVITTELGYHVIYRKSTKEKDKLEDIKDNIIKTLAEEKMSSITTITTDAMKYFRKLYNMDIIDSTLDRQYGIYLNNLLNNKTDKNE